jgi:hypothetical protein
MPIPRQFWRPEEVSNRHSFNAGDELASENGESTGQTLFFDLKVNFEAAIGT